MASAIDRAVAAGMAALVRLQAANGGFPLRMRSPAGEWQPSDPLFSTASILLAAGSLLPRDAAERACAFVLRCRRPDGLWDFDPGLGVPPDSDMTACALAALAIHGGAVLDDGASVLRSFWRPGGGPFQTWRGEGMWSARERDDAVVNCNIVFALAKLGTPATPEELAAVRRLMQASDRGARYYCAPSSIAYAAHRAGIGLDALPPAAAARPAADDLLASAQWLCGMRVPQAALIGALLRAQRKDGLWPVRAWCIAAGNPPTVWGSEAVTTAYALEALTCAPPPMNAEAYK